MRGRAWLIGWLGAVAMALLVAPTAVGSPGLLSWSQPANFSSGANGANPDRDPYGATPWGYGEVAAATSNPTTFTRLGTYSTSLDGGLDGWTDGAGAVIGVDPGSASVANAGDTFTTGTVAMQATASNQVAVVWTSPFAGSTSVTVSGSVASADTSSSCGAGLAGNGGYDWSLQHNGTSVTSGTSSSTGTISATAVTVPAGGTVDLLLTSTGAGVLGTFSTACAAANAKLSLTATATPPTLTLTSPQEGSAYVTPAQPTFAGTAGDAFGDSRQLRVDIYAGSATGSAPVQTLSTQESGGSFSVTAAPLDTGDYTAVVTQSDLATPADTATLSTTFTIDPSGSGSGGSGSGGSGGAGSGGDGSGSGGSGSGAGGQGSFLLSTPANDPLTTTTPTFSGTAPVVDAGDPVGLTIYQGAGTTGSAARYLTGTIGADGSYSFLVTPGLADGVYTAQAIQSASGKLSATQPVEFVVKVNPPALTLVVPAAGANSGTRPVFFGAAGDEVGDDAAITVTLFSGSDATGPALGTVVVDRSGGGWGLQWPSTLRLGIYTVLVDQSDDAGHTTTAKAHTFLVVPTTTAIIGSAVTVAQNGLGGIPILCPAAYPKSCKGTVTVTTVEHLRLGASKRKQALTLFQRNFSMYGSEVLVVRGGLSRAVDTALRHVRHLRVNVAVSIAQTGGKPRTYRAVRTATIAS